MVQPSGGYRRPDLGRFRRGSAPFFVTPSTTSTSRTQTALQTPSGYTFFTNTLRTTHYRSLSVVTMSDGHFKIYCTKTAPAVAVVAGIDAQGLSEQRLAGTRKGRKHAIPLRFCSRWSSLSRSKRQLWRTLFTSYKLCVCMSTWLRKRIQRSERVKESVIYVDRVTFQYCSPAFDALDFVRG